MSTRNVGWLVQSGASFCHYFVQRHPTVAPHPLCGAEAPEIAPSLTTAPAGSGKLNGKLVRWTAHDHAARVDQCWWCQKELLKPLQESKK